MDTPDRLEGRVAVVAQALDNQWAPRPLLPKMVKQQWSRKAPQVQKRLDRPIRTELRRALINAEQVVVNRAYLYNNPSVFRHFAGAGRDREAFRDLLGEGAIVPFLFKEGSPVQEDSDFRRDETGFAEWQRLCREGVSMRCLRLSWDAGENTELRREQLARRFHEFAMHAELGNPELYTQDLGIPAERSKDFRLRLRELRDAVNEFRDASDDDDALVSREVLYARFVTEGGNIDGTYAKDKAFATEIKQLIDLAYNSYLPDALNAFPLTPQDSLPRSALQELERAKRARITPEKLLGLIQQEAFERIAEGLYLRSIQSLTLRQILEIRHQPEWEAYIRSLRSLLDNPLSFADPISGAVEVYRRYGELAGVMTKLATENAERSRWQPVIELIIDVAGAALSMVWDAQGLFFTQSGAAVPLVTDRAAPVVARLVVRGLGDRRVQSSLRTDLTFLTGRMADAVAGWNELMGEIRQRARQGWVDWDETASTINPQDEPPAVAD
jgi:hypothetical protein